MKPSNLLLSLAAGLIGGAISNYVAPRVAHAQNSAPREVRAHRFTLLNDKGEESGTFAFDGQGRPVIQLFQNGREVWSAGGSPMRPLASR